MKKVYFITGNKTKARIAQDILACKGITLTTLDIDAPEIQSLNGKEVCEYAAITCAQRVKKPVVKTDVSYSIPALNGFPGPFVKFINHMLTAQDLLHLMQGKKDRTVFMIEYLSYAQPDGSVISFQNTQEGTIAKKAATTKGRPFDQVIIRKGHTKHQSTIREDEMHTYFCEASVWHQFIEWVIKKNKKNL